MSKTESEIERERKAVQAVIGAKGAVEKVLSRNNRLETRLAIAIQAFVDIQQAVGDLHIKSHRNKPDRVRDCAQTQPLAQYIQKEIDAIKAEL